jgi:hypothetical protein
MLVRLIMVIAIFWLIPTCVLSQEIVFKETCGHPNDQVAATTYTGWSNPVYPAFSGNAVVDDEDPSHGYIGASGHGNIYFRNRANVRLLIDWINTVDYLGLRLEFGILRLAPGSATAQVKIETSIDGVTWKNLPFTARAESISCEGWELAKSQDKIPAVSRLRIRISTQSANPRAFRVDDITLRGDPNSVLPVKVSSFNVKVRETTNLIRWTTLSETNILHYALSRSTDGSNWHMIALIRSIWHSSSANTYEFIETEPVGGITYYQLLVYEEDGTVSSPRIIAAMRSTDSGEVKYYDVFGRPASPNSPGKIIFRKTNNSVDRVLFNH